MVPAQALVVPKYLTVADLPFVHTSLLNDPLAIWLPAVANAFNLYLLKRFFDQIPRDVAGGRRDRRRRKLRTLWSIVLPDVPARSSASSRSSRWSPSGRTSCGR